jgi:hypothetical protein
MFDALYMIYCNLGYVMFFNIQRKLLIIDNNLKEKMDVAGYELILLKKQNSNAL